MNLEFVCFFVAFEASEAAKFEDGQLAYERDVQLLPCLT